MTLTQLRSELARRLGQRVNIFFGTRASTDGNVSADMRSWEPDADLIDTWLVEKETMAAWSKTGVVADLYLYERSATSGDLITNFTLVLSQGGDLLDLYKFDQERDDWWCEVV